MASEDEKSIITSTGCSSNSLCGGHSSLGRISPCSLLSIPRNSGTDLCCRTVDFLITQQRYASSLCSKTVATALPALPNPKRPTLIGNPSISSLAFQLPYTNL